MEMIAIKNLTKKYGDKVVYENFNLDIKENKITVILGESGSGKTTLLRAMANLTDYTGEITGVPDKKSMVFQTDRLIPNLTVKENLTLINPDMDVEVALKRVGLDGTKDLYPKSLSGGMARRVAIVRALNFDAPVLFMDEPFINLDISHKFNIIDKIKADQKAKPKTVIVVTHDVKEAVSLADTIIVIKDGKVVFTENKVQKNTEDILYGVLMGNKN